MDSESKKEPRTRGSFAMWAWVIIEVMVVLVGLQMLAMHPTADWVEAKFIDGSYPVLESALAGMTARLPFPVGDWIVLLGAALILIRAIAWFRYRGGRRIRLVRFVLEVAAIGSLYTAGFYGLWAWCYERAPVTQRVQYDASAINARAVSDLTTRAVDELNRLGPIAHRGHRNPDLHGLAEAVLSIAKALGDHQDIVLPQPKKSVLDWYLTATGIGGYINPYSAEDIEASDVLWFERPDFTAHEWGHTAGFAREDEANYIAALACIRSNDPVVQYSGWQQIFLYLPRPPITNKTFIKEVWEDFAAIRARDTAHVNLSLSRFQWHFYNNYLKANHVTNGTVSYSGFINLLLGIARDPGGLPRRLRS